MFEREIEVNGERWSVSSTGRITQYGKDEFGLRFARLAPEPRVLRVVRYSPRLSKNRESALAEMHDDDLARLLAVSQPSWTAPDLEYQR